MLDFVRQYASGRLAAAGEDVLLADRHRAYFRELAERADRELWAPAPAARARTVCCGPHRPCCHRRNPAWRDPVAPPRGHR